MMKCFNCDTQEEMENVMVYSYRCNLCGTLFDKELADSIIKELFNDGYRELGNNELANDIFNYLKKTHENLKLAEYRHTQWLFINEYGKEYVKNRLYKMRFETEKNLRALNYQIQIVESD